MVDRRSFLKGLGGLSVSALAGSVAAQPQATRLDYAFRTGMIPKRFSVDELFNDLTAALV